MHQDGSQRPPQPPNQHMSSQMSASDWLGPCPQFQQHMYDESSRGHAGYATTNCGSCGMQQQQQHPPHAQQHRQQQQDHQYQHHQQYQQPQPGYQQQHQHQQQMYEEWNNRSVASGGWGQKGSNPQREASKGEGARKIKGEKGKGRGDGQFSGKAGGGSRDRDDVQDWAALGRFRSAGN